MKHRLIIQLILFNVLIFLFGFYISLYIINDTKLIVEENKPVFFTISIVTTLLVNIFSLILSRTIQNNLQLLDTVSNLNDTLKYAQKMGKIYSWEFDFKTAKISASEELLAYLNIESFEALNIKTILKKTHKKDRVLLIKAIKKILSNKEKNFMFRIKQSNEEIKWLFSDNKTIFEKERPVKIVGILQDLTDIYQTEESLTHLSNILDDSLNEIQIFDSRNFSFLKVNKQSLKNLGYSQGEILSLTPLNTLDESINYDKLYEILQPLISKQEKSVVLETFHRTKLGGRYPVEIHFFSSRFENKDVIAAIILDMTEKKKNEEKLNFLAFHDQLTGLANRAYLHNYLEHLTQVSKRENLKYAILYMDLDRFKLINDAMGHASGDEFLQIIAKKIKVSLRDSDFIARLGGDEFVVVMENIKHDKEIALVAEQIVTSLSEKVFFRNKEICVGCSIGISVFPENAQDISTLLTNADIAMYHSKHLGGGQFSFFSHKLTKLTKEKLQIEHDLRQSIAEEDSIIPMFQPQLDIKTRKVSGAEALVRWKHPEQGIISPARFIPIAEESSLIIQLGDLVLKKTCRERVRLLKNGYNDFKFAVNLSGKQLQSVQDAQKIIDIVKKEECPPELIELEITESVLMEPSKELLEAFALLKNAGFKLALDDFGTGYSSLSYLKIFPLDYLKVDGSFMKDVLHSGSDQTLVKTIINLGHGLNLEIIAEGVELKEHIDLLEYYCCDYIQGYHISKPLTIEDFEEFLQKN